MKKILLLYENYQELMSIESSLKQVGFDVVGLSSERLFHDQMLTFYPDVVICSGDGVRVNPLAIGKRLKDLNWWHGQSIFLFQPKFKKVTLDHLKMHADLILDAPVEPVQLIQVLAQICGIDEKQLLDKLKVRSQFQNHLKSQSGDQGKKSSNKTNGDLVFVTGRLPQVKEGAEKKEVEFSAFEEIEKPSNTLNEAQQELDSANVKLAEKLKKYSAMVKDIKVSPVSTLNLVEVRRRQKEISIEWDAEKLIDLDGLRREFAVTLAKK